MSSDSLHSQPAGRVSPVGVTLQAADTAANEDVGLRFANPAYAAWKKPWSNPMTKTQTLGQPAGYDDWLEQSCCLENLIGQPLADQFRQQRAAQLFFFHIMVLLNRIFVPQVVAQTHSQNVNSSYVADIPEFFRLGI